MRHATSASGRWTPRSIRVLVMTAITLTVLCDRPAAQNDVARVRVAPNGSTTSEHFQVATGEALVLRLVGTYPGGPPTVGIYVHREDGTLVGMPDSERRSDAATFSLAEGTYYVLFRNTSATGAEFSLQLTRDRGDSRPFDSAVVRVLYATDRQRLPGGTVSFGAEPGSAVSYGYADVSNPPCPPDGRTRGAQSGDSSSARARTDTS